jgi:membrane protein YdbS with pleckstrin-like domain
MGEEEIIIRKTPFLYLKWLVIIEFLFALLPFLAAVLPGLRIAYDATTVARTISYTFLVAIIMTTLQVLILVILFVAWYFPVYHVDRERILYRRSNLFEDRLLVRMQAIAGIRIKQGPVARRLDYGSLEISRTDSGDRVSVRNIPNPAQYAAMLEGLIQASGQRMPAREPKSVYALVAEGEGQYVEYKSSLLWDYHRQVVNKALYEPVMKNVAGFMNAAGGTLVIGIADDGTVLGLEPDYAAMKKPDADGFENVFNMAFNKMIGVEFRRFVDLSFYEIQGTEICMISVQPSSEPAFLTHRGKETFYVRAGNGSQPLSVSKATRYIQDRFGR